MSPKKSASKTFPAIMGINPIGYIINPVLGALPHYLNALFMKPLHSDRLPTSYNKIQVAKKNARVNVGPSVEAAR